MVAQGRGQLGAPPGRGGAVGMGGHPTEGVVQDPDAQRLVDADLLRPTAGSAAGAITPSPGNGAQVASRTAAVSRTECETTCWTETPHSSRIGPIEPRPRDGLRPTRPHMAAGMRIDPPPSEALAHGTIPEATAAAAPPLDPPGPWSGFHGLCVGP